MPYKYPFEILPIELPTKPPLSCSWNWLELLRIEALLRSQQVHRMYRLRGSKSLFKKYGFTWDVLKGIHHRLLTQLDRRIAVPNSLVLEDDDNDMWNRFGVSRIAPEQMQDLADLLNDERNKSEMACVVLDLSRKSKTITRGLTEFLSQYRKAHRLKHYGLLRVTISCSIGGEDIESDFKRPLHMDQPSPIRKLEVWLRSLKCYDLTNCLGKSFPDIAHEVFGKKLNSDLAEKDFGRIERLIRCALTNFSPDLPKP